MVTREPFKVNQGTAFSSFLLTPQTGWPLWTVLAAGIFMSVFGCFSDLRWLMAGLIVCLAVIPPLSFILLLSYVSSPEIVANFLPHTLERTSDGYLLRIFRPRDEEEMGEDEGSEWRESGRMLLRDCDIVATKATFDYDIMSYKDSPLKLLYVPRN